MWEDSLESALLWQSALATLPLPVLRVLPWLLVGFAITPACGLAGVIAVLGSEWRHDRAISAMR